MEDKSLPPAQLIRPKGESESLDIADANAPVSSYSSGQPRPDDYQMESLEVHTEGDRSTTSNISTATLKSVPFSRRRATLVSLAITILVVLATATSALLIVRRGPEKQKDALSSVPTQDVSFGGIATTIPSDLQGGEQSLLVNGNIITRGVIKVRSGSFFTTLTSTPLTANQTISLPNASGTICLDTNNCNAASQVQVEQLQAQLNQIVIPAVGVTSLNDQGGAINIQGSVNRIGVTTSNGVITISTPQDLDANANVQFNSLTVNATGEIKSNFIGQTAAGNDITIDASGDNVVLVDGGRTFVLPGGGGALQTLCTTQGNCGGGGATPVILAPGSAQTDSTADASIFINDTGGGNLIQLQSGAIDRLTVAANGNTMISGSLTVAGLGSGVVRATGGLLSIGAVNVATEVSGTLAVTNGGTGAASLSANGVLVGNGTSAITSVVSGAAGLCLVSNAGAPSWQACPGGGGVTTLNSMSGAITVQGTANQINVASGAGLITLSTPQDIATTSDVQFDALELTGLMHSTNSIDIDTRAAIGNGTTEYPSNTTGDPTKTLLVTNTFNSGTDCLNGCAGTMSVVELGTATNPTMLNAFRGAVNVDAGRSLGSAAGLFVETPNIEAGGSLAVSYGVYVDTLNNAGTNIGLYVQGASTYGIWIDGGLARFDSGVWLEGSAPLRIEGATFDAFGTNIGVVDPTANRTILFPDLDGTVCLNSGNCIGSGGSAPNNATYLVTSLDGTLTNERAISAGTNISLTDGGAGGSFTVATVDNPTFSTSVTTPLLMSTGALTVTPGGAMTLGATGQTAVLQGSTTSITSTGVGNDITLTSADQIILNADSTILLQDSTNITGHLGVGTLAAAGNAVINASETFDSGYTCGGFGCYGLFTNPTANNPGGLNPGVTGVYSTVVTAATSFVLNQSAAFIAGAGTLGAGSTITTNIGVLVENQTKGGNDYGIWIQGADTYALWVDSGISRFDGNLEFEGATDDASEFTITVADPTADRTYTIPNSTSPTDAFCLVNLGNCAGSGGGVTGSGTNNRVAKFTTTGSTIGDSSLSDDGSTVTAVGNVNLAVQGTNITVGLGSTRTGSITLNNSTNNNTVAIQSGITSTSYALTLPTAVGAANQCLKAQNGTGTLFWDNCLGGGGGGGITSFDGQTGPSIALNNATGAANVITIDDAAADGATKGIAAFNATNFTAAGGVINTAQGISTSAAPQFAGLTLTGNLNLGTNTLQGTTAAIDLTNFDVASNGNTTVGGSLAVTGLTTLNGGLTVEAGDTFTFNGDAFTDLTGNGLQVSSNALTLAIQANKGLEVDGSGLSLIDCALDQILKYNGSNQWVCAADAGGSGVGDDVFVNGVAATNVNFLDSAASGTSTSTAWSLNTGATPDEITLTIGNASATEAGSVTTGAQTFAGAKTFNGQIVAGAGISLGSQTLQGTTAVIDFTNFDVSSGGTITALGDMTLQGGDFTVGTASQVATIVLHDGDGETAAFTLPDVSASYTLILPTAVGGANQCLKAQNGTGTLFWDDCLGGTGGAGITSIDGQTGPSVAINNATGAANVITIDDAAANGTTKGIAAFNATNFSASSGVINTIQGISTAATPQFAGLTLTGNLQVDGNSTLGSADTNTLTVNASSSFTTDVDVVLAELENWSVGSTVTGTTSVSVLNMVMTNNSSSGTQNLALLQNGPGSGITDGLLVLDNADADTAVAAGIVVTAATGGGIATAIDVSDPDITNALSLGANDVSGSNFTITGATGAVTGGTYNGQTISSTASLTGTLDVAGLTTLSGGLTIQTSDTFTINGDAFTDLTGNGLQVTSNALTLDASVSGDGLSSTTSSGSGLEVLTSGLTLLQGCNDSDVLKWNETSDTWGCAVDNGGTNPWATDSNVVNLVTDGNTVTIGSNTAGGKLFIDGDADEIQLQVQANASQTAELLVVEDSGGVNYLTVEGDGDVIVNVNNGNAIALQDATTITGTTGNSLTTLTVNNDGSTGSILVLQDNATPVFTVADGGNITSTGQLLGQNGTNALPAYSFSSDPNTGMYRIGVDQIGMSTNGTLRLTVSTAAITSTLPYVGPVGADITPTYTFTGDADTGMYRGGSAGEITFSSNGTQQVTIGGSFGTISMPSFAGVEIYNGGANNFELATTKSMEIRLDQDGSNDAFESFGITSNADTEPLFSVYERDGTPDIGVTFIQGFLRLGVDGRTIADNGGGTNAALTLNPISSYVEITCNDTNGCDVTMGETGAEEGQTVIIVALTATGTQTINETANVADLAGAGNFTITQYDALSLIYIGDRWIETGRSVN